MDAQLAQIYGTGQSVEDDQVKLAAAELLVKLAEDNGVDLNQFSDADVAQMVSELQKTAEFPPKESKETAESKESKESSESGEKAAEEKVAEADFLGRVMAHSFNQELTEIQKEGGVKEKVVGAGKSALDFLKKQPKDVKSGLSSAKSAITGKAKMYGGGHKGEFTASLSGAERKFRAGEAAKKLAPAAGAAAALGGAGYFATRGGKEKKSSALDTLAVERAFELAKEAGWVDTEGNLTVPQQEQKTASALEIEVERRALQMLEAEGLPVQWNE